jgi:serine/threonine-protein kinase HipA
MTSNADAEAFVWIWLPGAVSPVVAGRLAIDGQGIAQFNYGRSYLERSNGTPAAISIHHPELPLQAGLLSPLYVLKMAGCLRDASPDAWGRRVILNKLLGRNATGRDTLELSELTYLLHSGSDRIGALDFQRSASEYVPRAAHNVALDELLESAQRVEQGIPLTAELDQALLHGSSIGGARPKALVEADGKKYIAKFGSQSDLYSVVKAEFIAMRLAALVGIDVAAVHLVQACGKDVLLIERFDRQHSTQGWTRKLIVSVLTLLGLDEMQARYASYETLTELIRHRAAEPQHTLRELYSRLMFNILCGNTDDHARNHAAFWDGKRLALTPAYDLCPQARSGRVASQAMLICGEDRSSQLSTCLAAAQQFLLTRSEAQSIADTQRAVIEDNWRSVCDEAQLGEAERNFFWHRQFLNPFAFGE